MELERDGYTPCSICMSYHLNSPVVTPCNHPFCYVVCDVRVACMYACMYAYLIAVAIQPLCVRACVLCVCRRVVRWHLYFNFLLVLLLNFHSSIISSMTGVRRSDGSARRPRG